MLKETRIHLEEEEKKITTVITKKTCYTGRCIYSIQYSINVMELNIYKNTKNRIVVYLKKKKNPKNILTKVSPLGELKYMQHNTIASSMFFMLM